MSTKQERQDAIDYLQELGADPRFEQFVIEPLERQIEAFRRNLENQGASDAEVRQAQGAIYAWRHFLSWFGEKRVAKETENVTSTARADRKKRKRRASSLSEYLTFTQSGVR